MLRHPEPPTLRPVATDSHPETEEPEFIIESREHLADVVQTMADHRISDLLVCNGNVGSET